MSPREDIRDDKRGDLDVPPEFSRIVQVSELGDTPLHQDLTATPDECTALAKRFDVQGIVSLDAQVKLTLLPNKDVRVDTHFKAQLQQTCTVTLQPMKTKASADFSITYSPDADEFLGYDEEDLDTLDPQFEPFEPLIEEKIDIGEAIAEQFALEIDPFPRVKGTVFDGYSTGRKGAANAPLEKKNPFAVLSQLKTKQENKK